MDIRNKTAIVTGGAQGFGEAFTEALLEKGANVVVSDINVSVGLDTVNRLLNKYGTGRLMFVQCDVTNEADLKNLFQKAKSTYSQIDIVVNNAGIAREEKWYAMIDVNLTAVIHGTQLALEYMNKDKRGRGGLIINVGSTAGLTVVPFEPVYSATKAGVVMYSRSVAARTFETTDQDIRVVTLCPSFTNTKMVQKGLKNLNEVDMSEVQYSDLFKGSVGDIGIMTVDRVVTAFLKLIEDTHNNGGVLAVSPKSMFYRYNKILNAKM